MIHNTKKEMLLYVNVGEDNDDNDNDDDDNIE